MKYYLTLVIKKKNRKKKKQKMRMTPEMEQLMKLKLKEWWSKFVVTMKMISVLQEQMKMSSELQEQVSPEKDQVLILILINDVEKSQEKPKKSSEPNFTSNIL